MDPDTNSINDGGSIAFEQEPLLPTDRPTTVENDAITSDAEHISLFSAGSISLADTGQGDDQQQNPGHTILEAQASKAIDIAGGEPWTPATPSPPSSFVTTNSGFWRREQQVLLDAGPAPPDYSQATASRAADHAYVDDDDDSLYRNDRNDSTPDDQPDHWRFYRLKAIRKSGWTGLCIWSLLLLYVLTTVVIIIHFRNREDLYDFQTYWDRLPRDYPVSRDYYRAEFHKTTEEFHHSTPQCEYTSFTEFLQFDFIDPQEFSFEEILQETDYHDFGNVSITGNVEVRQAPGYREGFHTPLRAVVSFATTRKWKGGIPGSYKTDELLRIHRDPSQHPTSIWPALDDEHTDLKREATSDDGGCLDIWVGLYVNGPFNNFSINTENLNIAVGHPPEFYTRLHLAGQYSHGWSFRIREQGDMYSRHGNITTTNWDGRNAYVGSESGTIKGGYKLNDNLTLETQTGDIEVEIEQIPASESRYFSIGRSVVPANLTTTTGSGKQRLTLLPTTDYLEWIKYPGLRYLLLLSSHHRSTTGSVSFTTGDMWEGVVHAKTGNGSIVFEGDEFKQIPGLNDSTLDPSGAQQVWAKKGTFGGQMKIETDAGDIHLRSDLNHFGEWHEGYCRVPDDNDHACSPKHDTWS